MSISGKKIPSGKDFDSSTGKLKSDDLALLDEQAARDLVARIQSGEFRVTSRGREAL